VPESGPPILGDDKPPVRVVDLDWHSTLVVLASFVGLIALTGAIRAAPHAISILIVGSLLALALNPLVSTVERWIGGHRAPAVLIVLIALTIALAGLVALLGPPAVRQARQLSSQAPRVVRQLGDLPIVGHRLEKAHAPEKVQTWIEELPDRLSNDSKRITRTGGLVIDGFVTTSLTLLVSIALMLDGERLIRRASRLVPARRRERAARVANLAYGVVGRYVAGSLLVAAIAGTAVLIVGLLLGVPLTPLLAVWVALFDLVPQIGGAVGGIPFVALGFTRSPTAGVICAIFFVLYLNFENHILQPLVIGRAVHLSPPATMIAALVGVSALGVVGGLIAVPTVGAAKAIYLELWAPQDDSPPPPESRLHLPWSARHRGS
jgi:predicted PurR-regulated permease PerM